MRVIHKIVWIRCGNRVGNLCLTPGYGKLTSKNRFGIDEEPTDDRQRDQ